MNLTTEPAKQQGSGLPFVFRQPFRPARKHVREAFEPRNERMQRWHYRLEKLFARQLY
jgi:hypothetical protein